MIDCDLAIIGSGFGGSLLAIIARQLGRTVALLERGTHPRFAIGESSTPLADFQLARIADRFGLDWLRPFAKYGSWKKAYPHISCGLKRGFSFFRHEPGKPFVPAANNANALLVAASPDDDRSDTHWFRADFDAHLVEKAKQAGVAYIDNLEIQALRHERRWELAGVRTIGEEVEVRAGFLVDAAGDGQLLARCLGIDSIAAEELRTRSRALFSHFSGVARWHDVLREAHGPAATGQHTFPCDAAALHQIIDGGWMWILRFDNGITSAGFSLDPDRHPIRPGESAEAEWQRLLSGYPSLVRQFAAARPIRPFTRTGRLQRRLSRAAGSNWALLPHAAGFVDAWLSPGIAQTLFAVKRLGQILADDVGGRPRRLEAYGNSVLGELAWMDEITGSCFACFDRFEVMITAAMLYFVAAIWCEEQERAGRAGADTAFLLTDDSAYRARAAEIFHEALHLPSSEAFRFAAETGRLLQPWNIEGLCDPQRCNMYPCAKGR